MHNKKFNVLFLLSCCALFVLFLFCCTGCTTEQLGDFGRELDRIGTQVRDVSSFVGTEAQRVNAAIDWLKLGVGALFGTGVIGGGAIVGRKTIGREVAKKMG